MPLTPAHAAAAWPVNKLLPSLPLEPLVLGTLTPDFQYFWHLAPRGRFGHTLPGLILFCLPVGLIAWFAYKDLIRPVALSLLPGRLRPLLGRSNPGVGSAAVAIVAGAVTHIFWDSFTHRNGWGVRQLQILSLPIPLGHQLSVPAFKLLQHASTIIGGLVVFIWALRWLRQQPSWNRRYSSSEWTESVRMAALLLIAGGTAAVANGFRGISHGPVAALGYAAVGWMAAVAVTLLAVGSVSRFRSGVDRKA